MTSRIRLLFLVMLIILFAPRDAVSQERTPLNIARLLQVPHQYQVLKTSEVIEIDGKADEKDWSRAPWTEDFTDIESGESVGENNKSRLKMLWDSTFLYLFAEFRDQNLWASISQHDAPVFQDNAFELFVNPDGSTFNYFEFQINALSTVWDLFLPRPYRSGGKGLSSWDIQGLKKAVYLSGTLNNPEDKDFGWSIELAIPFTSLGVWRNSIKPGTIWRMNFSRVSWDIDSTSSVPSKYVRKKDPKTGRLLPPHYYVWSPQGAIDLHMPERYGFVKFVEALSDRSFLSDNIETLRLMLWKYFYLQQQYKTNNGKYAASLDILDKAAGVLPVLKVNNTEIKIFADEKQFLLYAQVPGSDYFFTLDHEGEFREERRL